MGNIGIGLELMVVGICTVFVILLIVIWFSTLLINVVNKIAPEEAPKKKAVPAAPVITPEAQSVIKAAVDILTAGKGQVVNIEKL